MMATIVNGTIPGAGPVEWFRSRFRMLSLVPTIHIIYNRLAFVAVGGERVTIDQQISRRATVGAI